MLTRRALASPAVLLVVALVLSGALFAAGPSLFAAVDPDGNPILLDQHV